MRTYRKATYKDSPTANQTTKSIVEYLKLNGFWVWRNNTFGIYDEAEKKYRPLQYQQRGVADIIGFDLRDKARFVAIEIKAGADVVSTEQHDFLSILNDAGGVSMVAHSFDDFLTKWKRRFPYR